MRIYTPDKSVWSFPAQVAEKLGWKKAFELRDLKARALNPDELGVLRIVLGSDDEWIARAAIGGVRRIAQMDRNLAIDLLRCADIETASASI